MGLNFMIGVGVNFLIIVNIFLEIIFRVNSIYFYFYWRLGLIVDFRIYFLNFNFFYDNDIVFFRRVNRYNKNLEEFKLVNNLLICY